VSPLYEIAHKRLKLISDQGRVQVLSTRNISNNKNDVDFSLQSGGKLNLSLLSSFPEPLQC
jgi:hypothetical protein